MRTSTCAVAILAIAVSGCVSLPERSIIEPTLPTWTANLDAGPNQSVVLDWWRAFEDPTLNDLVERAIANNADLQAADANMRSVRALTGEAEALRLPSGSIQGSVSRGRVSGLSQPPFEGAPERYPTQTLAEVGLALGWEADVFGRVSATVAAARAQANEALWLRRQTEAAVAAAVVRAYVEHRFLAEQEALVNERLVLLEMLAVSVERAETLGAASRVDRETAQAALALVRSEIPDLTAARRNAARRLAVLSGRAPDPHLQAGILPISPNVLNAGTPADMLRRRPDVGAAEQQLGGALAAARIAVADLYPSITIGGNVALSAPPDRLGDDGALGFGFGPRLSWGLFDLPRLLRRVEGADLKSEAALAQWHSVVLAALEESDGALEIWAGAREASFEAARLAASADRIAELAAVRETAGQISRSARIRAELEALDARLGALGRRSSECQGWIAAQLALGAGWRDASTAGIPAKV